MFTCWKVDEPWLEGSLRRDLINQTKVTVRDCFGLRPRKDVKILMSCPGQSLPGTGVYSRIVLRGEELATKQSQGGSVLLEETVL
jgi:hypothetical protein